MIEELKKQGFNGSEELSRQFIKEQIQTKGRLLPWVDRLGYSEEMLKRRVNQHEKTSSSDLWFFDRGIPDLIAYIRKDKLSVPEIFYVSAKEYRYNHIVFLTPPWKDIYENDSERRETFEEAKKIHAEIVSTYLNLGYETHTVPKGTIDERVSWVLNLVGG